MKGIFCAKCMTIRSLNQENFNQVRCECGNFSGWWTDGSKGIAKFQANDDDSAFVIEWSNVYLVGVTQNRFKDMAGLRELHTMATDPHNNTFNVQDEYGVSKILLDFHRDALNCWSFIQRPGKAD